MPEDIKERLDREYHALIDALQAAADSDSNDAKLAAGQNCAWLLSRYHAYVGGLPAPMFTREEISQALNWAADEAQDIINPEGGESSDTIEADDIINLVVNLAGERLDGAETAADAVSDAYGGENIQEWHGWKIEGWPEEDDDSD
jgi:hypothetical protein